MFWFEVFVLLIERPNIGLDWFGWINCWLWNAGNDAIELELANLVGSIDSLMLANDEYWLEEELRRDLANEQHDADDVKRLLLLLLLSKSI
jgi:hypothetical protein